MEVHDIPYFRNLWKKNVMELENQCNVWEKICCDNPIPDDVHGEIRTAIGLARLLVNQKLKQFKGLIDDSEFHTGEKEITFSDLEGFWDMVYFEVEKIQKSFSRLNKCKNNDWKFVEEKSKIPMKKILAKKDITAISKKKEIANAQKLAARQRIAEARKRMAAERKEGKDQNQIEIILPIKTESENIFDNKRMIDKVALSDKTLIKEFNEKREISLHVLKKKNTVSEISDPVEESFELYDASKQKSAQKKKHHISNKENVFLVNNSFDKKHSSPKQTKTSKSEVQVNGKTRLVKQGFTKLQCVTRSAAKKALVQ